MLMLGLDKFYIPVSW